MSVARIGRVARTASAVPLFSGTVTSVTHALKAASFAVEPIKVITQSMIITTLTVAATTLTSSLIENARAMFSREIRANTATVIPQSMYPAQINTLRRLSLSLSVPMMKVVTTAATALQATMTEISFGVPPIKL